MRHANFLIDSVGNISNNDMKIVRRAEVVKIDIDYELWEM